MDNNKSFEALGLCEEILKALRGSGYSKPTPIQSESIPLILEGKDLFACAQTGTGKTAAFVLPILNIMYESTNFVKPYHFRGLILVPTRELADQVSSNVKKYGEFLDLNFCKIHGGVSQKPQIETLKKGVDILIATPGRLLDLANQKKANFDSIEFLVLDEADRMLDMGFIHDIRKICNRLPERRQSLLFSATLSKDVEDMASFIVKNPVRVNVTPESPTVDKIDQKICFVDRENKFELLKHIISTHQNRDVNSLCLIFCRTKRGASRLMKKLTALGTPCDCIHGDKSQSSRQRALIDFKERRIRILIATDIVARGIDVKDMALVINHDMPVESESYVHRIGRTARAQLKGKAISLCSEEELSALKEIEKYIKKSISIYEDNPFHDERISKSHKQYQPRNKVGKSIDRTDKKKHSDERKVIYKKKNNRKSR